MCRGHHTSEGMSLSSLSQLLICKGPTAELTCWLPKNPYSLRHGAIGGAPHLGGHEQIRAQIVLLKRQVSIGQQPDDIYWETTPDIAEPAKHSDSRPFVPFTLTRSACARVCTLGLDLSAMERVDGDLQPKSNAGLRRLDRLFCLP